MIGVEFASIFRHFGTEVTIVEMLEHLIPMEDADASKELERAFKRRGIATNLGARATEVAASGDGVTLQLRGRRRQAGLGGCRSGAGRDRPRPEHERHRP